MQTWKTARPFPRRPPQLNFNFIRMDPLLLSAIAATGSAVASGASSLTSGLKNEKLMKKQFEYNEKSAENAYARQLDFYNRNNQYNDPSAVRQRYEAAGVNPNAAFGTAGSYTPAQASATAPQAGAVSAPYASDRGFNFSDPLDAAIKAAQVRNIEANTAKTQGDTVAPGLVSEGVKLTNSLKEQQIISEKIAVDQQSFDLDFARDTRELNYSKLEQSVRNMEKQNDVLNAQYLTLMDQHRNNPTVVEELKSRIWKNAAQVGLMQAQAALARKGVHLTEAQIEKLSAEVSTLASTKALIDEQVKTEPRNRALIDAKAELEKIDLSDVRNISDFNRRVSKVIGYLKGLRLF